MHTLRLWTVGVALLLSVACASHKPPVSLSGPGVAAWRANEALVALDTVMHSAIALNEVQVCSGQPMTCHPALSEQNTRVVVQAVRSAAVVLGSTPDGWPIITSTALDQVQFYVDAEGQAKLKPYIDAAKIVLASLGGR